MIENNLIEFASREANADPLTELLRQGARQLIAQAVGRAMLAEGQR